MNTLTETQVHLFASAQSWIEGEAVRQLYAAAKLDGVRLAVGFPDLHPGEGTPVGADALRSLGRRRARFFRLRAMDGRPSQDRGVTAASSPVQRTIRVQSRLPDQFQFRSTDKCRPPSTCKECRRVIIG